jgi:hypothetical protein
MTLNRVAFILKKKLIHLIEKIPTGKQVQTDEERNLPFSIPLQISGHLLRNLPIKEESLRLIANFSRKDAKSYYLYAVVSEVLSSCMSCMRVASWIKESEEETLFGYPKMNPGNETISGERIFYLMHESIVEEFEIRYRKLQEYLCNLICFTDTNDPKYFQLFFASEALSDIQYANQDISEFFGNPIANFDYQISDLQDRCTMLSKNLDKKKCWFLGHGFDFNKKILMSSYRQRYIKALSIATNGEKVVLGPTYKVGYGGSSKSAHALVDDHFRDYTFEDVKRTINKIPVISLNILDRAFKLSNLDCPKNFKEILDCAHSGEGATKGIEQVTKRNLELGDLVTTDFSDVAEILDVHISKYGYKSYQVRYLINPKIEKILEEWLPPRYIGPCLLKKQQVREFFLQKVTPLIGENSVDWAKKQTDEALYDHAKAALLGMAKDGHLKIIFNAKPK